MKNFKVGDIIRIKDNTRYSFASFVYNELAIIDNIVGKNVYVKILTDRLKHKKGYDNHIKYINSFNNNLWTYSLDKIEYVITIKKTKKIGAQS